MADQHYNRHFYDGNERRSDNTPATIADIRSLENRLEVRIEHRVADEVRKQAEPICDEIRSCRNTMDSKIEETRSGYKQLYDEVKGIAQLYEEVKGIKGSQALIIELLTTKLNQPQKTTNVWVKIPWQLWASIAAALAVTMIFLISGEIVNIKSLFGL